MVLGREALADVVLFAQTSIGDQVAATREIGKAKAETRMLGKTSRIPTVRRNTCELIL